jgi:hypothetical protein
MSRRFAALFAVAAVSAPAWADTMDNPTFASWAKMKKGSSVTVKITSEVAGQKSETTMTTTLVDLTADVATTEMVMVTKAGGMEFKNDPIKTENKKVVELPPGKKKEDFVKPEGFVDQGEETLKIGGKEYKTKWVKVKIEKDGSVYEAKTWSSDDVPGTMVKMETKSSGGGANSSTLLELVEIKKP